MVILLQAFGMIREFMSIYVYLIFMSLIVLYFLHSTSVLSLYIDVVLTLSILTEGNWVAELRNWSQHE